MHDCPHWKANCHKCLVRELVEALAHSIPRLCEGCYLKWPYTPKSFKPIGGNIVETVGEGDSHAHPRGGVTVCTAQVARAVLEKAKQMDDCIPTDEISEAAANQGHRWG